MDAFGRCRSYGSTEGKEFSVFSGTFSVWEGEDSGRETRLVASVGEGLTPEGVSYRVREQSERARVGVFYRERKKREANAEARRSQRSAEEERENGTITQREEEPRQ